MTGEDYGNKASAFRKMSPCFTLFILLTAIYDIEALPNGAPESACSDLRPVHPGADELHTTSSYKITVENSANKLRVKISSTIGEEFQGFVLQARSNKDNKIIEGKFSENSNLTKAIDCFGGYKNTLTHFDTRPKNQIVTEWVPSLDLDEYVIFRGTVAKSYFLFYTVDSTPIKIVSKGSQSASSSSSNKKNNSSSNFYLNCFETKGCIGLPKDCVNSETCEILLSYSSTGTAISFTLKGRLKDNTYMAMGISKDDKMGDDLVTACYRKGSSIKAEESYNKGKSNEKRELSREYKFSFENGISKCSWTNSFLNTDPFDLENENYFILLAKGLFDERLGYHYSSKIATAEKVNFTAMESISVKGVDDAIKVHGCFMITFWIGLSSIAIILARHFKTAFEEKKLQGVDVWFALHRSFMLLGLVFLVIAFITIFVYKDGWNYETSNPHAIFGTIATVLAVLQPIMAAFRPAPDHQKRPIFNWMHFIVGNTAYILAMITIFLAVSLESSGLKDNFYYVMSVFVVIHVLFHCIFQVHTLTSGRESNNEVKMLDMGQARSNTMQNNAPEKKSRAVSSVFRILLLGLYNIFLLIILVTMYSLIAVA